IAATTNILCNLILIPRFGSMGAALATLIAYVLLAGATYVVNQRIYPIPFEMWRFAIAFFVGLAIYLGANGALHHNLYLQGTISLGALCLYGIVLALLSHPFHWIGSFLGKERQRNVVQ